MKDFRRFVSEDHRVLASPEYSQQAKRNALANLAAKRVEEPRAAERNRQRPAIAYRGEVTKTGTNVHVPGAPSIEDEMNTQPPSAHGHPTYPGSYQQFTSREVRPYPKTVRRTHNNTNYGFPSDAMNPSAWLMSQFAVGVQESVMQQVAGLHTHAQRSGLSHKTVFERFEAQNDISQEELYCIAKGLDLIKEEMTSGKWVVTMPWSNPSTPEEVLYNQRGVSNVTAQELNKMQTGNYWMNAESAYKEVHGRQVPPAKPQGEPSKMGYVTKDIKSKKSLKNPERGDDFIRQHNIAQAKMEEQINAEIGRLGVLSEKYEELKAKGAPFAMQKKAYKKLKESHGKVRSLKAQKAMAADEARKRRQMDPVTQYADRVESIHHAESRNGAEAAVERERANYNRHLSLLESAKNILSKKGNNSFA